MSFLNDFNYDSDKASKGVWFDEEQASFLIGHIPEVDFLKMISKEVDKIKAKSKLNDKDISQSQMFDITLDLVVKHRLLDWKGQANGVDMPEYTPEKANEMLRVSKAFRDWVNEKSSNIENYYKEQREKRVKK